MIKFVKQNKHSLFETIKELCNIPAPSHYEHKRAEYCKNWLDNIGAKDAYIDSALNVILPINCDESNEITVFVAHTDTVFSDTEPMPFVDDGEFLRSPGVGDDTTSVSVLLHTAKYFIENDIKPKNGVMFVCNSCEEGLGNLKGTKQIFKDFEGRISRFISFDGNFCAIADRCVGSHRYQVEIYTEGGHSYGAFGNKNAIAELSRAITKIYEIEVPVIGNSKTTYNVGEIIGGTSVNTIAQNAAMLCEYRSDNKDCLDIMKGRFESIFQELSKCGVELSIELVGDRPCMGEVDTVELAKLTGICKNIIEETTGIEVTTHSSSTDCNVPLSLGIPAVCVGVYSGGGAHTREEWVDKSSVPQGLVVGIKIALALS